MDCSYVIVYVLHDPITVQGRQGMENKDDSCDSTLPIYMIKYL